MSIKQKMRELKRELILEEAGNLFNRDGYEHMKIAELAANVGVSVGSIYTMFGSKENLYNNFLISQVEYYHDVVRTEVQKHADPTARLNSLAMIKFGAMVRHRKALRESVVYDPTFFLALAGDSEGPLVELFAYIAEEVMRPLGEELGCSRDPLEMVYLFDGLTIGMVKYWMVHGGDLLAKVDEAVTLFLALMKERT